VAKKGRAYKNLKKRRTKGRLPKKAGNSVDGNSLAEIFARIDEIRKGAKPLPEGMTIKDLIEEGRR
jgi:hypothetical protein